MSVRTSLSIVMVPLQSTVMVRYRSIKIKIKSNHYFILVVPYYLRYVPVPCLSFNSSPREENEEIISPRKRTTNDVLTLIRTCSKSYVCVYTDDFIDTDRYYESLHNIFC